MLITVTLDLPDISGNDGHCVFQLRLLLISMVARFFSLAGADWVPGPRSAISPPLTPAEIFRHTCLGGRVNKNIKSISLQISAMYLVNNRERKVQRECCHLASTS